MAGVVPLLLDGSTLEGGGQLLRNSISLAALLRRDITINNIRANRSPTGLKPQHATGIDLVKRLTSASVDGLAKGSESLTFRPKSFISSGSILADTRTAGSITLLLQVGLPCLVFAQKADEYSNSVLKLRGGTNAIQAPQIDYTENIFLPFIAKHFGIQTRLRIKKRGYWPKGGGEVHVDIPIREMGKPLPSVQITSRGNITSITGFAYVAGLPKSMAKKMQDAAIQHILSNYTLTHDKIDISARREPEGIAVGRGSGVFLWAETDQGHRIAGSSIGSKDLELEDVAITAAKELLSNLEHGGCVDEYLQDQIIIFMALAEGKQLRDGVFEAFEASLFTRTAIWVAEQMTSARFDVTEDSESSTVTIRCRGIGFVPSEEENRNDNNAKTAEE